MRRTNSRTERPFDLSWLMLEAACALDQRSQGEEGKLDIITDLSWEVDIEWMSALNEPLHPELAQVRTSWCHTIYLGRLFSGSRGLLPAHALKNSVEDFSLNLRRALLGTADSEALEALKKFCLAAHGRLLGQKFPRASRRYLAA